MRLYRLHRLAAVLIIVIMSSGYTIGHADPLSDFANDRPFYDWLMALTRQVQADPNYHRIPLDTDDQIHEFTGFLHQAYHGQITHTQFTRLIETLYPGHQYEADFIIKYLPQ